MEIIKNMLITIFSSPIIFLISCFFRKVKVIFYKILKMDIGTRTYINKKNNKIYVFPKKQKTRVSVSVLAKIEKDGKFLLKNKEPNSNRQDNAYKPLGGAVKISNKMKTILKRDFSYDKNTRYSSKDKDFRIFLNLYNNKIIHKIIYSETLKYYQEELKREIQEELNIKPNKFEKLFTFDTLTQPISIQVHYTESDFSVLANNDYVHHIIFELKIKNKDLLEKLILKNKKKQIKWISLHDSENIAITSYLLAKENNFQEFKKN